MYIIQPDSSSIKNIRGYGLSAEDFIPLPIYPRWNGFVEEEELSSTHTKLKSKLYKSRSNGGCKTAKVM